MIYPAKSDVTLEFGAISDPYSPQSPHSGTDFGYLPDNTIYAPFSGRVTLVPNNGRDGNGIYMTNGRQFHGLLHTSRYLVTSGQQVSEGQPIGIMGETGFTQGTHLHWCVKVDGVFINPLMLVDKQEEPMLDKQTIERLFVAFTGLQPQKVDYDAWLNKPTNNLAAYLTSDGNRITYLKAIEDDRSELARLKKEPAEQMINQIKEILGV